MVDAGLLDAIVQGLITGSIIAGGALGLSLIYNIAEVPNFAHGDMITIGAYLALVFNNPAEIPFLPAFGSAPLPAAAIVGVVLAGALGAAYELTIFRKFRQKDADIITMVIVSLGLALVLRNVVLFLVGSKNIRYESASVSNTNFDFLVTGAGMTVRTTQRQAGDVVTTGLWGYPWWLLAGGLILATAVGYGVFRAYRREEGFDTVYLVPPKILGTAVAIATAIVLGALIQLAPQGTDPIVATRIGLSIKHLTIVGVVLAAMFALNVALKTTKFGRAMRATADNMDLAEVRGVDADRVQLLVWVIASMLAALAGVLTGWFATNLTPNMGFTLLLPIFAAVILGGISSPYGAVAGAMIIGVSMDVSVYLLPSHFATYRIAVAFLILIGVLMIKPEGLWGDV
ncbi:branched-chain amino acid ABC transporter permease [Haloarcula salina]|uniref:Branched-chain amino acid ABC transporter permease n=1 Tax=Haloarcula salina TaxID=1429914 RepID=A0AA41KLR5_9EURY|nr:branched-chain amino acid ABC transporter permease [Haloarcula salina]MBV0903174.1 branched-chain amino acid ABC transporter permease [Haloarcula salina]